eukprot:CAMPEP_0201503108 /NCGR_PEP_ID=MMETSP0151_2-20130828/84489_1 /ASSEMBLY_ACC=CAM_ASM_000257 /TAXON_ID=200890 /ORGANISM="Paramoeba atlantica, Strain 621/1 / CCAP 1560/9" /LENGTH=66 /DNA_ID=CAMNT_0047896739 /DNA_START=1121 /DNA_END=1321 /DNA_ORIENTATION=+
MVGELEEKRAKVNQDVLSQLFDNEIVNENESDLVPQRERCMGSERAHQGIGIHFEQEKEEKKEFLN